MNIALLIPGFSADEQDWCIPVYLNLARGLAQRDSVNVFAMRYPPRRAIYSVYELNVHALGGRSDWRGIARLRLWLRTLMTLVREHPRRKFDLLHAVWADETGLLAVWAGRLLHIPAIVSIAGGELVGLPAINYGLQRSRTSRWVVASALSGADRVIAPCNYAAQPARKLVRPERLIISPLGVDTDRFKPAFSAGRANISDAEYPHLLAVGSLSAIKDQAAAIRVLARLRTSNAILTIAGEGSLHPALAALAGSLGIDDRVRLIGAVEHDALPVIYGAADLHILTSAHEAFGMVTIEAAACAVPTIGYERGVLPDMAAYQAGIALPPGDERALAAAIDAALDDRMRLAAMGDAARKTVLNHFSLASMVDGVRGVYASVAR